MCSGNACTSNGCCARLYDLYCQIFQIYRDCPPNAAIIGNVPITLFLTIQPLIQPLFNRAKCGKIDCCDGIADSIICAYKVALNALTTTTTLGEASGIISDLSITLEGILTAAGYYP